MTRYVAFLRAVNVGGTGRLPMSDLRAMCADIGLDRVRTYIASGNVVFSSKASRTTVRVALEKRLRDYAGKDVGVVIHTAAELRSVLEDNPFPDHDPRFTLAIFLARRPPANAATTATGRDDEEIRLGKREIYVYFPRGMGRSRLRIAAAEQGTARNMNTVRKMVEMAFAESA